MIKIRSKKAGFRRCGIAHPKEQTQYPDDRFSKDELAMLKAERMLTVEIVPDKKEKTNDSGLAETGEAEETVNEPVKPAKKGKR